MTTRVPVIRTTYDIISPREEGEEYPEVESGWIDEEGVPMIEERPGRIRAADRSAIIIKNAIDFLRGEYATEASSSHFHHGIWYSTEYEQDYGTGEEHQRSFHLDGFTEDEERLVYEGFKKRMSRYFR